MLIKQVMARPVPTHPKWKYRMAYSTIFPAILYRMKCPYSPANYLKGDYEVRAVTMKEQRTTGGELKKMQYHT